MKGTKEVSERNTYRTSVPQAISSVSHWIAMVIAYHTCNSFRCYQVIVAVGMMWLWAQMLLMNAAAAAVGAEPSELHELLLQLPSAQIQIAALSLP